MKSKKIKLLFEGTMLSNGLAKNSCRSGIYFVAYNVFREMIKKTDLDISLHCKFERYEDLKKFLKVYFPEKSFNIYTSGYITANIYKKLKQKKDQFKRDNKIIQKILLQLFLIPYSLLVKILSLFHVVHLSNQSFDVYFSPWTEAPWYIQNNKNIKKFTILHDTIPVIFPELTFGVNEGNGWFKLLTNSFNRNDYYIANSNATKNDFLKYFPQIDPEKIFVSYLACNENFHKCSLKEIEISKKKYNIPNDKKYLFSLCSIDPRKNLIRILKTYVKFIQKNNIEDLYFVIGGGHFDKFIKDFERSIKDLGEYRDKILKIGYVDDEDLAPLYCGAEWFVYTSMYEGFGLPPLEAMASGCPVLASNNSSLPEVVGDAGLMIDWDSDEQHIEAYEKYYFNSELREENKRKGLERVKQFSWEKCTNKILDIIKEHI